MFEIEYHGANSVTISTKKATIVTDPKLSLAGAKDVSIKGVIELATEARFVVPSDDARLIIEGPGEYGIADFDIRGVAAQRHLDASSEPKIATMYRIETPDFRVGLIGNIFGTLSEDQLEELGIVDILIIPVGGNGYTLDAEAAASVVRQVDPKAIIPVSYADSGLNYEVAQDDISAFTTILGAPIEEMTKYKLKTPSNLPPTTTVIKLNRS